MNNQNKKTQIQNNIVSELPNPVHGLLLLSMRIGKTRIAIEIVKKENCQSLLWVTPNTKLRDEDIPKELKLWNLNINTKIVCYGSLHKIKGYFDKIILDEYQAITTSNTESLLNGNITFGTILGLSGTHPKHPEKNDILRMLNLKVIKKITLDDAVDMEIVSEYKITAISTELDKINKNVTGGTKKNPFLTTEQSNYSYLNSAVTRAFASGDSFWSKIAVSKRMHFIYNLQSKIEVAKKLIASLGGNTLCFSGSIAKAEEISKHCYHSKCDDKHLKLFQSEKSNILSCVNSGSVGFTFKNVNNVVIIQINSNESGTVDQKLARGLLFKEGHIANIYMLYCKDTVDEKWFKRAIEDVDPSKIEYLDYKNL